MGDGSKEITKDGGEVFGETGVRVMHWSHTYRNLIPRMTAIKTQNKKIQQELVRDSAPLQCSCHSADTFVAAFDLGEIKFFEVHYKNKRLELLRYIYMGHWKQDGINLNSMVRIFLEAELIRT